MLRAVISRIPIKITVPLLLTVPVLIVVVVLSTLAFVHGRSTASLLASENLAEIHDRINERVDVLLSVPGRINHINEGLIRQGKLNVENIRDWRETLFAEAVAFETLSAITWGSEDGESAWVCRYSGVDHLTFAVKDERTGSQMHEYRLDEGGRIIGGPSGIFEFDPRIRPWYEAPMRAGKAAWSEPFVWVGEDPSNPPTVGIAYGQPFRNAEGRIIGVIDADISLHDISQFLESLKIGKTGMAFVIDRQGLLIANSRRSPVVGRDMNRLTGSASPDKHIAAAADHLLTAFPSCAAITDAYQSSVLVDGQRHMLMVSPFEHETGLSWLVVTMVPENDFLAEVKADRRQSVVIGLIVVCLTVLLGIGLAMVMVRPFLSLVSQLRQIGSGDLERKVDLNQTPEFRQLSSEINRMTAGLRERIQLRQSLAVAMQVQQHLLPTKTPTIDGLDIAGHSTYCDETGGDYYDYLDVVGLSESSLAIAIGDVVGHGIAAAMLMATARGILVSHCDETDSLSDLLTHMNEHFVKDFGGAGRFMTMLLMKIDMDAKEVRWSSAGHDPPFVYDRESDEFIKFGLGNTPLGIIQGEVFEEHVFSGVRTGQVYLASTDGVWETMDADGDMFGKDRLQDLIRKHAHMSAAEISGQLRAELVRFGGELGQNDDVTFVVVKVL